MKSKYIICPACHGEGTTVNPSIDAHGLGASDFHEDPDFAEAYRTGLYDITCQACNGQRVVTHARLRELRQHAADRRLAAQEDGDWDSYTVAGDYRFG